MIHPETYIAKTPMGLGLFAKKKFNRGEILWIVDDFDVKIPLRAYQGMDAAQKAKFNIYSYLDYENRVIVPWDEGKYVNHSCAPNSTGVLQYDNISIALRDIEKVEEIVEDYYCYFGHFETFACSCGARNCRRQIKQEDTYDAGLRLDLEDVAELILNQPQYLLDIEFKENKTFRAYLQSFAKNNGEGRARVNPSRSQVAVA
jgi:hypothetical protein